MKSHVRERIASKLVDQGMRRIPRDGYDDVEFSPMIKEIINAQAPELNFTNWKFIDGDKVVWKVDVENTDTKKSTTISSSRITECIDNAKRYFKNFEENT